jgi:hypothetical protein
MQEFKPQNTESTERNQIDFADLISGIRTLLGSPEPRSRRTRGVIVIPLSSKRPDRSKKELTFYCGDKPGQIITKIVAVMIHNKTQPKPVRNVSIYLRGSDNFELKILALIAYAKPPQAPSIAPRGKPGLTANPPQGVRTISGF